MEVRVIRTTRKKFFQIISNWNSCHWGLLSLILLSSGLQSILSYCRITWLEAGRTGNIYTYNATWSNAGKFIISQDLSSILIYLRVCNRMTKAAHTQDYWTSSKCMGGGGGKEGVMLLMCYVAEVLVNPKRKIDDFLYHIVLQKNHWKHLFSKTC